MLGLRHRLRDIGAEHVAIDGRRLGQVAHGNRNVIETTDHLSAFSPSVMAGLVPAIHVLEF